MKNHLYRLTWIDLTFQTWKSGRGSLWLTSTLITIGTARAACLYLWPTAPLSAGWPTVTSLCHGNHPSLTDLASLSPTGWKCQSSLTASGSRHAVVSFHPYWHFLPSPQLLGYYSRMMDVRAADTRDISRTCWKSENSKTKNLCTFTFFLTNFTESALENAFPCLLYFHF